MENGSFDENSSHFNVAKQIIAADWSFLPCVNQGHRSVWYLKGALTLLKPS